MSFAYIISDGVSSTWSFDHAVILFNLLFLYQVYPPMFSVVNVPKVLLAKTWLHTVGSLRVLLMQIKYSLPSLENPPYSLKYFKEASSIKFSFSSFTSIKLFCFASKTVSLTLSSILLSMSSI